MNFVMVGNIVTLTFTADEVAERADFEPALVATVENWVTANRMNARAALVAKYLDVATEQDLTEMKVKIIAARETPIGAQ